MEGDQEKIIRFYKRRIEPFVAIFILTFIIVACVLLYQDNLLKEEIGENCGYEDKNYVCYCEKDTVENYRELMLKMKSGGVGLNVELDWDNNSESSN